jgi:hypothetical protein
MALTSCAIALVSVFALSVVKVLEGLVEVETGMSVFFVWEGRFEDSSDPCKDREGFVGWVSGVAEVTGAGAGADDDGVPPILREMVGAGRGTSICSGLSSGGGG